MRKICVFVGANFGLGAKYSDSTIMLAKQLAQRRIGLVYGGGNTGLMGALANTTLSSGGEVTGVITEFLLTQEIAHKGLNKLHVVKSMQARKAMMTNLADAFIALPGGLGTIEEMFEIWNAIKIGLYKKPLGLLNIDGYFDPLLGFLKHSLEEQFVQQSQLDLVTVSDSPASLLDEISLLFDNSL